MATAAEKERRQAEARVGTVLKGKWRVDGLLGMGGMAAVYAATHRNGSRVAVKVLLPSLSEHADVRERFLREGFLANAVGHPGTVQVHDEDETDDGAVFLVMDLLEGEPLDALVKRRGNRLPVPEVLALADQLLDVLAAAHARGIVHRDIKPQNLFLTRSGALKVLDFGIARLRQGLSDNGTTQTGVVLGTLAYMAPEQAGGKTRLIDGRTDLWSVGATLFRMLAGRVVHLGETDLARLAAAISQPAPSLANVMPELPPAVTAVVDRALAFDRDQRWPDALAMQAALRSARGLPAQEQEAGSGACNSAARTLPAPDRTATVAISNPSFITERGADKTVGSVALSQPDPPAASHRRAPRRTPAWALVGAAGAVLATLVAVSLGRSGHPAPAHRGVRERAFQLQTLATTATTTAAAAAATGPASAAPDATPSPVPSTSAAAPAGSARPKPRPGPLDRYR